MLVAQIDLKASKFNLTAELPTTPHIYRKTEFVKKTKTNNIFRT